MPKKFSIVVPVYQNESNLHHTVPRLLDLQENLPDFILELVLVDDGSTDGSLAILEHYAELHPSAVRS